MQKPNMLLYACTSSCMLIGARMPPQRLKCSQPAKEIILPPFKKKKKKKANPPQDLLPNSCPFVLDAKRRIIKSLIYSLTFQETYRSGN